MKTTWSIVERCVPQSRRETIKPHIIATVRRAVALLALPYIVLRNFDATITQGLNTPVDYVFQHRLIKL